jgi:hypothetical protein
VSGFKFTPEPPSDLSEGGGAGYITSVIISRYPSIKIGMTPPLRNRLADALTNTSGAELSFLGRSLGAPGSQDGYGIEELRSAENGPIMLGLQATRSASNSLDERAWVLAVKTESLGLI